jgi:hypothetical protein
MKIGWILNTLRRTRMGRVLFLLGAFVLLATIVPPGPPRPAPGAAVAAMTVTPVPLDAARPERRRIGRLQFLRGWSLHSDDPRFGAISAMHVGNGRVTAISDAGTVLEFAAPGRRGAQPVRIRPLPSRPGTSKRSRDTEALQLHGGSAWVGFEYINAVKRFRLADWREESTARPPSMRRWRGNSGAEAMVRLPDGRFLVFSEGRADGEPFSPALLFEGDPAQPGTRAIALRYRRPPGFRVTDAALLPDGRLLVLNRRLRLFDCCSASLVIAEVPAPREGGVIAGREIARLEPPLTVENMEALSVAGEGGRTIVRIASDDNFMPILRTLLLEFALIEGGRAR